MLEEAPQLNRKGCRDADPPTSTMPDLSFNDRLQPEAGRIDLQTRMGTPVTLLGPSLRVLAEGTRSDPCQSGLQISNALAHIEGISAVFCRKPKVSRASTRRLRWTDGTEACVTAQAEARSRRRRRASGQPKVAASA
jgi:hypothetical protein